MTKNKLLKIGLIHVMALLFIFSAMTPATPANNVRTSSKEITTVYDYDCYHRSELSSKEQYHAQREYSSYDNIKPEVSSGQEGSSQRLDGPIDSPWPMYCHDVRHTSRSYYSTTDNSGYELWRITTDGWAEGGPTIDENGTIYIGSWHLYAVYPNGTLKWKYLLGYSIVCAPAIDENGTIYFGSIYNDYDYLYALYPNGTLKWKCWVGNDIFSSPVIGDDGVIYVGSGGGYPPTGTINAIYPNGTLKWKYDTNHVVYSSPAIGQDGTIYCGCHDTYLYALYPNNGTLKWKYGTGDWIRTSPCIADDGTIYCVSLDGYLHAIYPNGTLKWKTDVGAGTSPTIGQDGTIYCGWDHLYAVNPSNGSVKWTFNVGGTIEGGTPCNSIDGTIYVGTSDGGELIAVNLDGTLKWREKIGKYVGSPPAIGSDGAVYVGSDGEPGEGHLHAFGVGPLEADASGPYYGLINQPVQIKGLSSGGYSPHSYHWDFGDTHTSDEQNPMHTYTNLGNYTVVLTVTDNTSNTSSDSTWAWIQTTNTPPNKPTITGTTKGKPGTSYDYIFKTTDIDGTDIWYYIEWGDGTNSGWIGPCGSGVEITQSHTWDNKGTFTIRCKAKDPYNAESDWGTLSVTMPLDLQISQSSSQQINQQSSNQLLLKMLQRLLLNIR